MFVSIKVIFFKSELNRDNRDRYVYKKHEIQWMCCVWEAVAFVNLGFVCYILFVSQDF